MNYINTLLIIYYMFHFEPHNVYWTEHLPFFGTCLGP